VENETGDLLADSHNILKRWKYYFCWLLTIRGINNVSPRGMHIAKSLYLRLVLLRYKLLLQSSGIDQMVGELIQAGCITLHAKIHKFISSIWNKEELLQLWKGSIHVMQVHHHAMVCPEVTDGKRSSGYRE